MQAGHDDGSRGRVVVAGLDVAQALGEASTHGTEVLRGFAFRFLPFDSHPRWPAPLRLAHASYHLLDFPAATIRPRPPSHLLLHVGAPNSGIPHRLSQKTQPSPIR